MPYRKDSGPTKCGVKSDWGWGKKKLKGVGVADLGFCCADFRQTSRGNDSKTFLAWRTTLQDYLEKYNNLVLCHLRKHRLQKKPLKSDLKSISFRNFDNFFWIFIKRPQSGNTDVWSRFFSIFVDAITKKTSFKIFEKLSFRSSFKNYLLCQFRFMSEMKSRKVLKGWSLLFRINIDLEFGSHMCSSL